MAGLSTLRDGNGVNFFENCQNKLKIRVDSKNLESIEERKGDEDEDIELLRGLFDRILGNSLRDAKNAIRPIPALLGDGQPVDLFRLFYMVRERGGFDSVSTEKLWGVVAEKLDFDFRFSALLKLIYFKYFDELDRTLNSGSEYGGDLELFSIELERSFRGLPIEDVKVTKLENTVVLPVSGLKRDNVLAIDAIASTYDDDDDDEKVSKEEGDKSIEKSLTCKRKSRDWEGVLSWLKQVAKKPREMVNSCSSDENGGKEAQELVLLARKAMLKRKYADLKDDDDGSSSDQKKQKILDTIYEDPVSRHPDSVRVSRRVPPAPKKDTEQHNIEKEKEKEKKKKKKSKTLPLPPHPDQSIPNPAELYLAGWCPDKLPFEKQVNVGPQFQAELPPCTGEIPKQDSDKLGTTIWQPNNQDISPMIGKGRPKICDCPFPGSVPCVRFHTAENNLNLKLELGRAFYQWRFDKTGELASLSWTQEEEEKFKKVMTTTSLSRGKFFFPKKTRKEFLDYYFNVFLQSKRSYQNRVHPNTVDSDDDEMSEFGSVGGFYGRSACNAPRSAPLKCVVNDKCTDFDMAVKVKKR